LIEVKTFHKVAVVAKKSVPAACKTMAIGTWRAFRIVFFTELMRKNTHFEQLSEKRTK
jgi:hypothetical protein